MKHAPRVGAVAPACPMPPVRRPGSPWAPTAAGPYKLPRVVQDRLTVALAGFRNREAAFTLAVFLARFWSAPRKLLAAFPIDRRALAEHEALRLTEARVRGALTVLVEVGFLARYEPDAGRRYQRTESGLQRRAILHRFGEEFAVEFARANARSQAARGAAAPARRPISRPTAERAPTANLAASSPMPPAQVAQKQNSSERGLIMGEQIPAGIGGSLEAALDRLRRAGGF